MEWLRNIYKLFNIVFPFVDFVYILQLEEYDTRRYFAWMPRFFLRRTIEVRQHLVYTSRALALIFVSAVLFLVSCGLLSLLFLVQYAWFGWLIAIACIPLLVGAANVLLEPLFVLLHTRKRGIAARLLTARRSNLRVVMVAGSYGKTTTKSFIEALTRHQYRVQMPPGNINTPSGIAAWIVRNLNPSTTLLILEADGYTRGEYVQTCEMAQADVAVITNIGDQHLERFGSREALSQALSEVFALAQPDAHLVTTVVVGEELQHVVHTNQTLHVVFPTQSLKYRSASIEAPHLSGSQHEDLALALAVVEVLGVAERFVVDAVRNLSVPERRQAHTQLFGYEAIDDSYNISVTTAGAAIAAARTLAFKRGKRLLIVTAGIPELGPHMQDGNVQLGATLAKYADHTVVLGSIFARDIVRGLGSAPHTVMPSLAEFETLAHTMWSPHEWLLLLLPELNDLYY